MEIRSTTEIKIQKFILTYGADMMISWFDYFDKIISSRHYPLYRSLEKEACKSCDICIADMRMSSHAAAVNAKRIIAFIAANELKLSVGSIAILLNSSDRTINYYLKNAEDWINQPKSNKQFIESYNRVVENFKI